MCNRVQLSGGGWRKGENIAQSRLQPHRENWNNALLCIWRQVRVIFQQCPHGSVRQPAGGNRPACLRQRRCAYASMARAAGSSRKSVGAVTVGHGRANEAGTLMDPGELAELRFVPDCGLRSSISGGPKSAMNEHLAGCQHSSTVQVPPHE
jgi:hypothetical protein